MGDFALKDLSENLPVNLHLLHIEFAYLYKLPKFYTLSYFYFFKELHADRRRSEISGILIQ